MYNFKQRGAPTRKLGKVFPILLAGMVFFLVNVLSRADLPPELKPVSGVDYKVDDLRLGSTSLFIYRGRINFKSETPPSEYRYYYSPYVAFLKIPGNGNEPQIFVLDVPGGQGKQIVLPIQWNRNDIPTIVRDYFAQKTKLPALDPSQIQPVSLSSLTIETAEGYQPKVKFGSRSNPQPGEPIVNFYAAVADQQAADHFVGDLKAGHVTLNVSYVFEGASYRSDLTQISIQDIKSTNAFKDLTGASAPRGVTREQVSKIAQQVMATIKVRDQKEFTSQDIDSLAGKILDMLLSDRKEIQNGFSGLALQLQDLGFDAKDFKADLIQKSHSKQNSLYHTKFSDKVNSTQSDSSTKFDLLSDFTNLSLGFGNDEHLKQYARDIYQEVLSDWGVETSFEGEKFIPKAIRIYKNDFANLTSP